MPTNFYRSLYFYLAPTPGPAAQVRLTVTFGGDFTCGGNLPPTLEAGFGTGKPAAWVNAGIAAADPQSNMAWFFVTVAPSEAWTGETPDHLAVAQAARGARKVSSRSTPGHWSEGQARAILATVPIPSKMNVTKVEWGDGYGDHTDSSGTVTTWRGDDSVTVADFAADPISLQQAWAAVSTTVSGHLESSWSAYYAELTADSGSVRSDTDTDGKAKPAPAEPAAPSKGGGKQATPPVLPVGSSGSTYTARWWPVANDYDVYAYRRMRALSIKRVAAGDSPLPLLLKGDPGGGKTVAIRATTLDQVEVVQGSASWELADGTGQAYILPDGSTGHALGPITRAATHKHDDTCTDPCYRNTVYFDEMNLCPPGEVAHLHPFMDGRRQAVVPGHGVIDISPDFWLAATVNMNVPGAIMSPAMWSRFRFKPELESDVEMARVLGVPDEVVDWAKGLYAKARAGEPVGTLPSIRDMLPFRDIAEEFGTDFAWDNLMSDADEISLPHWADAAGRRLGRTVEPLKLAAED